MRGLSSACTVASLALALTACAPESSGFDVQPAPDATVSLDGIEVSVYVADDSSERAQGLQGYAALAEGEGMLFIFDDLKSRAFAMKDVTFPIDVVFFSEDLTVSSIVPLDPGDDRLAESPGVSPYALELPQGWAADNGIAVGSELTILE